MDAVKMMGKVVVDTAKLTADKIGGAVDSLKKLIGQ